ncbi:response regulator transcription factor [Phyllobacterium sp. OV277]|jgi:DNA-binding NarL/FixJ family response regulator|uniref:response regulator transcription factor n=1 Tax=Phyllobacterium sp. OV277 TaxID=1882772 RepID=UPI00088029A4|nr:response regulator transcription factor [Phyllobacterium sp. OV277]SDP56091.1 two component transcriptional regulator, LuxR family [Phyllobacterium sp. OV277]
MKFKFVIVDDHPLFRGALKAALGMQPWDAEIIEVGDLESAKNLLLDVFDVDLVLLDLALNGVSGLTGLIILRALCPTIPIAVVSATDDLFTVRAALALGASGFISKSSTPDKIGLAVSKIFDGEIWSPPACDDESSLDAEHYELIACLRRLTPQQGRVLGMMAGGMLNKQIAHELNVSEATIKAHVSAVLNKLGVESRTQAVIRFSRFKSDTATLNTELVELQ